MTDTQSAIARINTISTEYSDLPIEYINGRKEVVIQMLAEELYIKVDNARYLIQLAMAA